MPDHRVGDKQVCIACGHCNRHCFSRGLARSGLTQRINRKTSSLLHFHIYFKKLMFYLRVSCPNLHHVSYSLYLSY